eukprot:3809086-Amphidinium_carterae.1
MSRFCLGSSKWFPAERMGDWGQDTAHTKDGIVRNQFPIYPYILSILGLALDPLPVCPHLGHKSNLQRAM